MKKINLLGLLLLLLASSTFSFGKAVSVSKAKAVGYNYLAQHGGAPSLASADDLSLAYTSGGTTPYFYVFSGAHCFVIVCAEDAVKPVIGYSLERTFHGDKIPRIVTSFFEDYNKQINYVISNHVAASADIAASWDDLINNRTTRHSGAKTTTVSPLLSTTWDQSQYYNDYCPVDAGAPFGYGGRCPTGCVATATSQVMKFWSYPTTGSGTHSYATSSYGTLSANFGTTTYNWAAMPNSVVSTDPSVATLMSDVGISMNMDYGPDESGAYVISSATGTAPYCAEYSLKNFFNYDPALHGESRSSYDDPTWISMLEADLNAGRPVIYAGEGTAGGHCFVFDGYDASDNMHVNWGWSGSGPDGYYAIDALNPPSLGTGGGAGGFNSDQTAIFGIQPPGGGTGGGGSADTLELYDYLSLSATSIFYTDTFNIITSIANYSSVNTFTGDFGLLAFDATTGAFICVADSVTGVTMAPLTYISPDYLFHSNGEVSMIPGTYTLGMYYRTTGGVWKSIGDNTTYGYTNSTTITVYNNNPIELYSAMTPVPNPMVQGSAASVSLMVYDNDATYASWSDSLYLGLYNLDGSYNSDIQFLGVTTVDYLATSGTLNFSTSSVTAAPGTYLMVLWFKYYGSWYIAGSDFDENPQNVTVVAPPLSPDVYEVNNTAATAYDLTSTLSWSGSTASTGTPGSNFHIATDQDYYKVTLASGYNYAITAKVSDDLNPGAPYTVDAIWSYSTDGGTTWSAEYDDVMPGTINFTGYTGGTVIFHCSPKFAGYTGTYLLSVSNITRTAPSTTNLPEVNLSVAKIYPNPASDYVTIDLSGTNCKGSEVTVTDVQGRKVVSSDMSNQSVFTIPVNTLAPGTYFIQVTTDGGTINKKITVGK